MKNYALIDLHLHFDGSLYLPWQYERACEEGIVSNMSFEEYYNLMYRTDYPTREEGMKRFDMPIAVLQSEDNLYTAIYQLIERLYHMGLLYAEIRFAPQQHTSLLSQDEVVGATIEGMNHAMNDFDIKTNLILCLMHKGDACTNMKENFETVDVAYKYLNQGVVALDLAGYENTGPFIAYKPLFDRALELGIPFTIHAGEMGNGSHVPLAIQMGASRIGHGIDSIQNEIWLQEIIDKQIPLEICCSSNCKNERNYAAHPIRMFIEKGVKVTINTDNMTFAKTT